MKKKIHLFRWFQKKAPRFMGAAMVGVIAFAYITLVSSIPDKVYINQSGEEINLPLPVVFTENSGETRETSGNISSYRNGSRDDVQIENNSLTYSCKLFGFIPIKEVNAQVVEERSILPGGIPVGIYVETDGVLVIGTGNVTNLHGDVVSPSENLVKSGDYIREVNGIVIESKEQLIESVDNCEGKRIILKILREGELIEVAVEPVESEEGGYKIGLWVRDDLAGIGTLTYVTEKMEYGALGHGVSDADTGTMLSLKSGLLFESSIVGVVKGESGTPGELTGVINYGEECLGSIDKNTSAGIYGSLQGMTDALRQAERVPVGYKQEIEMDQAEILSSVDGEVKRYAINITEVDYQRDEEYREIMFEVTDEELLEKTGGIVQGMSGSPILQNGKIIGAVTHVFIQNSKKGYGIFIEDMLENNL